FDQAWYGRGYALGNLGRNEDAIASYDKAIEIKPDFDQAWYNQACAYSLLNDIDTAIEKLQEAINLNPENRQMAKTDSDFDAIRDDQRFVALMQEQQ
ncbi:TPR end-of-group domain-containing protein, partial [Calothrix rhizosoleniae]|uniref:TPR end-of-group domain-containing protein n=1 Tax=Calothrix rhizosoleniae TaxID=888997 RepID=UPI001178CAF7